jgi:hypothetical protein
MKWDNHYQWNGSWRRQSWSKFKYYPSIYTKRLRKKVWKPSAMTSSNTWKIWTRYLPSSAITLENYCSLTKLCRFYISDCILTNTMAKCYCMFPKSCKCNFVTPLNPVWLQRTRAMLLLHIIFPLFILSYMGTWLPNQQWKLG